MRAPSKAAVFVALMAVSVLTSFVLPAAWTEWLRALFQPLAWLQMPVHTAGRTVAARLEPPPAAVLPPEQVLRLRRENEVLQRQVLQQRARLSALEQQLITTTGIAEQVGERNARIVIAPVVQSASSTTRATLRVALSEAQARYVRPGQWVLAPASVQPDWDPQATVADLRDRAWVVGRVSEARPRLATVQLTSDPRFRAEVIAARLREDGSWHLAPETCLLNGQGRSRMRLTAGLKCPECGAPRAAAERMAITQALRDYVREGYRYVLLRTARGTAVPLVLGRLVETHVRDDSPQHFDVAVEPWGRADRLALVYIQCPQD